MRVLSDSLSSGFAPSAKRYSARPVRLPDENDDRFVHQRLYCRIRHLILTGALAHGARLESSRSLAKNLRISRTSVVTAFDRLIADGWLEPRRGSGVYVAYAGPRCAQELPPLGRGDASNLPFNLGWPSDIFPIDVWNRLQARVWRHMTDSVLLQGDRTGYRGLRAGIAIHVALTRGLVCSPEQVVVTTSIPAGIQLAIRALGLGETAFWVEDPGCRSSIAALPASEVEIVPIPVDDSGLDIDHALSTAPFAMGALVSPSRQAPTGAILSKERRKKLSDWVEDRGGWILEDDFNWNGDGAPSPSAPFAVSNPGRTIYINSFNNILFPGLRVAYMIVPTETVDCFAAVRGMEGDVNSANQIILSEFIEEGYLDKHLRRLDATNAERRAALAGSVESELGEWVSPNNSLGGYYIATLNRQRETDALAICRQAGIGLEGMSEHRIRPSNRDEVILGFSQFSPETLHRAASAMRKVFNDAGLPR